MYSSDMVFSAAQRIGFALFVIGFNCEQNNIISYSESCIVVE